MEIIVLKNRPNLPGLKSNNQQDDVFTLWFITKSNLYKIWLLLISNVWTVHCVSSNGFFSRQFKVNVWMLEENS